MMEQAMRRDAELRQRAEARQQDAPKWRDELQNILREPSLIRERGMKVDELQRRNILHRPA
jgi:hypothetical protein